MSQIEESGRPPCDPRLTPVRMVQPIRVLTVIRDSVRDPRPHFARPSPPLPRSLLPARCSPLSPALTPALLLAPVLWDPCASLTAPGRSPTCRLPPATLTLCVTFIAALTWMHRAQGAHRSLSVSPYPTVAPWGGAVPGCSLLLPGPRTEPPCVTGTARVSAGGASSLCPPCPPRPGDRPGESESPSIFPDPEPLSPSSRPSLGSPRPAGHSRPCSSPGAGWPACRPPRGSTCWRG